MSTEEEIKRYKWQVDDALNVYYCEGDHERALGCPWKLAEFAFFVPGEQLPLERLMRHERALAFPEKNGWIVYEVAV